MKIKTKRLLEIIEKVLEEEKIMEGPEDRTGVVKTRSSYVPPEERKSLKYQNDTKSFDIPGYEAPKKLSKNAFADEEGLRKQKAHMAQQNMPSGEKFGSNVSSNLTLEDLFQKFGELSVAKRTQGDTKSSQSLALIRKYIKDGNRDAAVKEASRYMMMNRREQGMAMDLIELLPKIWS